LAPANLRRNDQIAAQTEQGFFPQTALLHLHFILYTVFSLR
jgi:hypothetical protein